MMINKQLIRLNIFFSLLQILVTSISYYFLYKFLLQNVGADLMGVWAIVLSVSSTANIANLGIGAGVIRYTAKFKVNGELENINKLIHTSFLFLGVVFLSMCIIIYLIAPLWLHAVVKSNYYSVAIGLIPYSLICLMLNALSVIFVSCIDGLQKNYLRSIIYIFSFTILISTSYLFVPQYGLIGVVYAQLLQSVFLFISSVVCLRLIFTSLHLLPFKWDKSVFKNIFSFGIQEQIISICQICFDPFTKSILGHSGDLQIVTYYEMANRLVTQLRGLLVAANQVFIPIFARSYEKSADAAHNLYKKLFSINFLLSILWLSFIIASVVPISKIWIGILNMDFVVITVFLACAYWCNIIISPSYFANMGKATLWDNVMGNIIIAVFNVLLCIILRCFYGSYGVIAGWSFALSIGSIYVIYRYHQKNMVSITNLLTKKDLIIILICILYCIFCLLFFHFKPDLNSWIMFGIDLFFFFLVVLVVYYIHPVSKILLSAVKKTNN